MEEKRELKNEEVEQVAGGSRTAAQAAVQTAFVATQVAAQAGVHFAQLFHSSDTADTAAMPGADASTAVAPAAPSAPGMPDISTINDPTEGQVFF